MKVGIVTITDYTNYGNRLQNYAVSHVLESKFGCHTESLAARKEKKFENGNYILWLKNVFAKKLCGFSAKAEKHFGCNVTRWANFCKWNRENIRTRDFYGVSGIPESVNDEYDVFFAGSDQIWNHTFTFINHDDMFLKFADAEKRAAISGSFGIEEIPKEQKELYAEGLLGFADISVREEAGAGIIKELTGREAPVLADPVMLLEKEEWLRVSKKPRVNTAKPYVLKYYLGEEEESEKIDIWAKENGFEVYELMNEKIPELFSAGPGEFISLIANADFVCSDSFHCIVFSIIFKRPFAVYERKGKECRMTSRMDTLLKKFGFENRWKNMLSPEKYLDCDFSKTDEIIDREKEKAFDYIRGVLKRIEEKRRG